MGVDLVVVEVGGGFVQLLAKVVEGFQLAFEGLDQGLKGFLFLGEGSKLQLVGAAGALGLGEPVLVGF